MERIGYSELHLKVSKQLKEYNDCTVMAWANVFDCDYSKAYMHLQNHGRRPRQGMMQNQLKSALDACNKAKIKYGPYSEENRTTLAKFCKDHPKGRYYVLVRGHALAVKDGVVYDFMDKPRRQVIFAARVYLEGEI